MSKISIKDMNLYYGDFHALKNVNLEIEENKITAFIGPSGCGKSTLLKSINRMNDLVEGCRIEGNLRLDGKDIFTLINNNETERDLFWHFPAYLESYLNGGRDFRAKPYSSIRAKLKDGLKEQGIKLTYNHILMKVVAKALTEFPDVNASFADNMLTRHKHVNMGLAVAKGDGLIVPNVKNCEEKSLAQIAQETEALIEATRTGKLGMEDMTRARCPLSTNRTLSHKSHHLQPRALWHHQLLSHHQPA